MEGRGTCIYDERHLDNEVCQLSRSLEFVVVDEIPPSGARNSQQPTAEVNKIGSPDVLCAREEREKKEEKNIDGRANEGIE